MKRRAGIAAVFLLSAALAPAQDNRQQKRPTLGPSPAPSLEGAHNAVTTDPARLLRVRNIYIERIDNRLSDELLEGLAKSGRFQIVEEREKADGVIRGTCFDMRRLKVLHSEIYLSDRASGASIWQDNLREPINPPPLAKAVAHSADVFIKHLAASIASAQRR